MKQLFNKLFFHLIIFLLFFSNNSYAKKIAIITSLYKADLFIEQFMQMITTLDKFDEVHLYIINAHSPGNEEKTILQYTNQFNNITYLRLDHDPGLYGVWNYAISLGNEQYIMNANVDDRLAPNALEILSNALDNYPEIDLVYGDYYASNKPNITFLQAQKLKLSHSSLSEFSIKNMKVCLPGPFPMWRRALHRFGLFDDNYKSSGDYEMWLRVVSQGSQFKKINYITGVYYINPDGISSKQNSPGYQESYSIVKKYGYLFK